MEEEVWAKESDDRKDKMRKFFWLVKKKYA